MRVVVDHPWDVSPPEAVAIQDALRVRVMASDRLGAVQRVAGIDVGYPGRDLTRAAVVVLDLATLSPCDRSVAELPSRFPYVPGLLSFREVPAVLAALERLTVEPDLLLCDGHGLAHPRRFGLACHLGVVVDRPSIGVAKTLLCGSHEELPRARGSWRHLRDGDEVIGAVVRTRARVRPVYVSVGHRVTLETAIELVLGCTPRFRLPETTRQAHRLASRQ